MNSFRGLFEQLWLEQRGFLNFYAYFSPLNGLYKKKLICPFYKIFTQYSQNTNKIFIFFSQGLGVVSGLFGLFIAANYALTSIILVELISLDRFTNAYGLLLLVQGIANLVGPPLAGWITDVTGNYDLAFYLSGVFIAVSGTLMLVLPVHGRYKKYCEIRRRSSERKTYPDTSQTDVENIAATKNILVSDRSLHSSKNALV